MGVRIDAYAVDLVRFDRFLNESIGDLLCRFQRDGNNPNERLMFTAINTLKPLWLTGMDLPDEKGTYVLIASVPQMKRIEIGRLGRFDIIPGYYAYVGSAFGSGGLRARLGHHLESTADPHWHIDYLLQVAQPVEIWCTTADRKLEHHWADLLEKAPQFRIPIPRFGSSDYHRSRSSHLFYSKRHPAFAWFRQQLADHFEGIYAERCVMTEVMIRPGCSDA